jgi:16S rRNA processing protein RimM
VLSDLFTDFPDRFKEQPEVSLLAGAGTRTPGYIEEHWLPTGRSAGRIVLKLRGVETISDAELLAGVEVQIAEDQRLTLDDQTYYVSDLIGCVLADSDSELGTVDDMHFPQDAQGRRIETAAALFVVKKANGDEVLIPFANEFVTKIDIAAKRIEMNLPQGLVEMNG